ncbi:hypothetical protein JKP10_21200 [Vibrio vulnificus]|uniref:hypothetical protein n=1 Tax=Vibrio TaxID=662 RepID=UPI0019D474ED|nr:MULTISPECIES: hypothetical protein [Vibrio]EGR7955151.1 hypothetical protein [Vibrio vulnificus]EHU5198929.1 hypothetical protein [Vibrio vulnificus]EHY1015797.1 hypothetical protein [Vibrio vulnificus]EHY1123426.1 hypothetical protein [Vibrio vulnificus]EIO3980526.1 hypothetical protein [Vibrio vulnificus]
MEIADLKKQYKSDSGFSSLAYHEHDEAKFRMAGIHGTSRIHKTCMSGPVLWNLHFDQLWTIRNSIPSDPIEFECWFKSQIKTISQLIAAKRLHNNCGAEHYAIGLAQKCLNLFLKDLWAFDQVTPSQINNFHAVLDSLVLSHCDNVPRTWAAWTNVIARNEDEFEKLYSDYLTIQKWLRTTQNRLKFDFANVVELEQFIWHFEKNGYSYVVKDKLTSNSS